MEELAGQPLVGNCACVYIIPPSPAKAPGRVPGLSVDGPGMVSGGLEQAALETPTCNPAPGCLSG